jgi:hypothetical protein
LRALDGVEDGGQEAGALKVVDTDRYVGRVYDVGGMSFVERLMGL